MKSAPIVSFEENNRENKFTDKRKRCFVFDTAMSGVYENNIFLLYGGDSQPNQLKSRSTYRFTVILSNFSINEVYEAYLF